jgi:hypothetical protein
MRDYYCMPSLLPRFVSPMAMACALLGCSGGDLQPIHLGDAGAEEDAEPTTDDDAAARVTPKSALEQVTR